MIKFKSILTTFLATALILLPTTAAFASENNVTTSEKSIKTEVNNSGKINYDDIIINRGSILIAEDFVAIKVEMEKGVITDETVKKLIVNKIIEKEKASTSPVTPQYMIWGMNLNVQELALVALYPIPAVTVYNDAQTAGNRANSLYEYSTLYLGNGDAFRHTYWNTLMAWHLSTNLAEQFATAHESTTPAGIDKTMDLNNNQVGRNIALYYSSSTYESTVIQYVNNGWLNRIVNGQLTITDSSGRL